MHLYVDESGNTGETSSTDFKFNFADQPFYALAGILVDKKQDALIEAFIDDLYKKYRIQGSELKSKNLYERRSQLVVETVDFIVQNEIPFFIELMDKVFYLNVLLVEHVIMPIPPVDQTILEMKRGIASNLSHQLDIGVYQSFIETCRTYSNESLEKFYDELIDYFDTVDEYFLKGYVQMTKSAYYRHKDEDPIRVLENSLPLPDRSSKNKLHYLLPNYNAFSTLIASANSIKKRKKIESIHIIHDEQRQFDSIFMTALEKMRTIDTDSYVKNTKLRRRTSYNIDDSVTLSFSDSKNHRQIQIADILAGFVMRFWNDFISGNREKVMQYAPSMKKLFNPVKGTRIGINFVVPDDDYRRFYNAIIKSRKKNGPTTDK